MPSFGRLDPNALSIREVVSSGVRMASVGIWDPLMKGLVT